MSKAWIVIWTLILTPSVWGGSDGGTGTVLVADHSFSFTAPKGWIMDDRSGISQGLFVVFYPTGQTWRDSPVMAFMKTHAKSDVAATIPQLVDQTIRTHGSPDYRVSFFQGIDLGPERKAMIYHYSGDRRGSHEAVAYIEEQNTFNCLVLSARDRKDFDDAQDVFADMVRSYVYAGRPKKGTTANPAD